MAPCHPLSRPPPFTSPFSLSLPSTSPPPQKPKSRVFAYSKKKRYGRTDLRTDDSPYFYSSHLTLLLYAANGLQMCCKCAANMLQFHNTRCKVAKNEIFVELFYSKIVKNLFSIKNLRFHIKACLLQVCCKNAANIEPSLIFDISS